MSLLKYFLLISFLVATHPVFADEIHSLYPKILFHGGGGGATKSIKDMSSSVSQLEKLGFPREHVLKIQYPDQEDLSEITAAVEPQLKKFMARYPSDTRFDVMGHSLGHVVSLITLVKLGLLPKLRKLIGLAGVMFGQLGEKPGLCRFPWLSPHYCGDVFDLLMGTTRPPFLMELIEQNTAELSRIEKCSLFSPEDGILNPFDSGAFEDGINISIPNTHHLKFKSSELVFEKMTEGCFDGEIQR